MRMFASNLSIIGQKGLYSKKKELRIVHGPLPRTEVKEYFPSPSKAYQDFRIAMNHDCQIPPILSCLNTRNYCGYAVPSLPLYDRLFDIIVHRPESQGEQHPQLF